MKKIGIFGGTFNPIHKGHLDIAKGAYEEFGLDFVYFVPTGYSYHKKVDKDISSEDRLNMVSLAIEEYPYFKVGDFDIKRHGPTYSVDTIKDIKVVEGEAEYYLILGSDAFSKILSWKYIEELSKEVIFLVAIRSDSNREKVLAFIDNLPSYLRDKSKVYDCCPREISSEEIRSGKFDVSKVPDKVYKYILERRLYF